MAKIERPPQDPSPVWRLRRLRLAARTAILFERVWREIWPALGVCGLFLCMALLDLPARLSPWPHMALLAAFVLAFLGLLARCVSRLAMPSQADADRRLERQSGLRNRPLAALTDRLAGDDPVAAAIWREHQARSIGQTGRLRLGLPRPGLARRDPRALRAALLVALVACGTVAGGDALARVARAVLPSWPRAQVASVVEITAWVAPPSYTRLPPFFLKSTGGAVRAPTGSRLTVSVTGSLGAPMLSLNGNAMMLPGLDRTSFQGERELREGGQLRLDRDGGTLAEWELSVIPDTPPSVSWTATPGPMPRGEHLRLPWKAEDDYGVVSVIAELVLSGRPDLPPVTFPVAVPSGGLGKLRTVGVQDLSAHPWAGLTVGGRLVAQDAIGQTSESESVEFDLPQRRFQNPVARLLVEQRRALSLHPEERTEALGALDALMLQPQGLGDNLAIVLNVEGIYYKLVRDHSPAAVVEAQQRMWELAVDLEDGQPERSARALEVARQEAREALARTTQDPSVEHRDGLDRALKALETAIDQHLEALMDQAQRDNADERADPDALRMDQRDMRRLAEAAREATKTDRMAEAKKDLAELEAMLQQLRDAEAAGNPAGGQAGAKRRAERREQGEKQIGALQDMIGQEGALLDHSQSRAKDGLGNPPAHSASPPPAAEEAARQSDQRLQQALQHTLGELMQQVGNLTGEAPSSLADANGAMGEAAAALADGKDGAAGIAQQKAIEALQKSGREMSQSIARQFGSGQIRDGSGERDGSGTSASRHGDGLGKTSPGGPPERGRDPLGRPLGQGASGAEEGSDMRLPEEQERQRAQAIQEELRRRGGDHARPQEELDYIDRLLRRF